VNQLITKQMIRWRLLLLLELPSPTVQTSQGVFKKVGGFLMLHHWWQQWSTPLFSKVYYVKIVTQPDIDAVFEYNYCIQITETEAGVSKEIELSRLS
jgi:hypothetical protein